ncbi:hypothetical protein Q5P01_018878 [Channa striata]|uniref:Uncharacterized protein n=1 Tax=Channa striata TaxID=64152 RepID=A0AA88SAD2_CHASR|nr:hypothetical protein Q5P01_018878 [Channa striata]
MWDNQQRTNMDAGEQLLSHRPGLAAAALTSCPVPEKTGACVSTDRAAGCCRAGQDKTGSLDLSGATTRP